MSLMPVIGQGQIPAADKPDALASLDSAELTEYRGLRRMHAANDKLDQEAWMDVWTELDPSGFRYQILSERGSEYVRTRVLKRVLERERELIAAGGARRAALTTDNYQFQEAAPSSTGLRHVLMKPRRKDVLLVDGRMVLNPSGTELLRVEGRLARNPSFWTSLVNVIREFATVDGVRVPISTESIARVKFAGLSRMMVRYEYESINGRPVSSSARRIASATGAR